MKRWEPLKTALCMVLGGGFLLAGVAPFFYGVHNIGIFVVLAFSAFFFTFPWLKHIFKHWPRAYVAMKALIALGFAAVFVVLAYMADVAYLRQPDGSTTALVLGCQVQADGNPSVMLQRRLEKAKEYLQEYPDAMCIVSGGQGPDEPMPESTAMKQWLVAQGIEEDRIMEEDASHDTRQNIDNSLAILREQQLGDAVTIITDNFHQARARITLTRQAPELTVTHISSLGPLGLQLIYWLRDMGGVVLTWMGLK